jgi:hypothetical protein
MRIAELDKFKEDNPILERYFDVEGLAGLGDGTRMSVSGVGQPVKAFEQGVIQRMKETIPGNTLGKTHKTKLPREW